MINSPKLCVLSGFINQHIEHASHMLIDHHCYVLGIYKYKMVYVKHYLVRDDPNFHLIYKR